ncbi:aldehyde dehydrogenase family protein [Saccharopolyspora karakumensis]|uniref:Aldehyde dehydrogenase family protein n=1 Tax=Saccharopolyspora karakumensis TaxID=2530386 RepID=A0A4R5BWK1_9PSEU|nr:aldehyde dehydrogenase family protein [Saccharopolyspora karakumensis]TDD90539.1 aldehyde dehydrogenase family protein [Saccharopolyspora karakumensis]
MTQYAVVDPSTGERVRQYSIATDEEVRASLNLVDSGYRRWSREFSVAQRASLIRTVGELHRERRDSLATKMHQEMGKAIDQALGEVDFSATIYEYYADHAEEFLADEPVALDDGRGEAFVRRVPLGPILGIKAWNYPIALVARLVAPNVVLGNTILMKHAPQCPSSAVAIEEIFTDAGVPEGVFKNIYATNEQIRDIIADPRIQGVSLTGSDRAGAAVAEVAGRHLKKVVLELGGSDPFIVLDSYDLDATVEAAYAARMVSNAGQVCNAPKRMIVLEDVYDEFLQRLIAKIQGADNGIAPLSSLEAAEKLERQVQQAVRSGAKLYAKGERRGAAYPPAVLADLDPAADVCKEELFGPVALVFKATDEDEAVAIANDTPYGLGSYVFGSDTRQTQRVAEKLDAGMVYINLVQADAVQAPFGGVKRSGFGRELGSFGIDEFVNKKLIHTR